MTEFDKRKLEIQLYIKFLNNTEENQHILEETLGVVEESKILRKVLFANTYLLLYNLVESTVRDSIQEIFDHFEQEGVAFDELSDKLKVLILTNVKGYQPSTFVENVNVLAIDIVYKSFDSKNVASGNIDAKEIRKIANKYGFSSVTEYSECKNGEKLLEVKEKRNNLAHGIVSFSECGRDASLGDIKTAFNEVSAYISNIKDNIQEFIAERKYLT